MNTQSQTSILNDSYFNSKLRIKTKENDDQNKLQLKKGFGLSKFQSSSTLQKSVPLYSFTKSKRFLNFDDREDVEFPNLPKTLSKRGTMLGYGNKYIMTKEQLKIAEQNPSSSVYKTDRSSLQKLGKSFGLSHEYYKKMDMPNENPGPGQYNTNEYKQQAQIKFKGKKNFQLKQLVTPSPCHYEIQNKQIFQKKDSSVKFHRGIQINFEKLITPGPSDYDNIYIHKSFNKFQKCKTPKQIQLQKQ